MNKLEKILSGFRIYGDRLQDLYVLGQELAVEEGLLTEILEDDLGKYYIEVVSDGKETY